MDNHLTQIPEPLRRKILLYYAVGVFGLLLLAASFIFGGDWRFSVPCAALAVTFCIGGTQLLIQGTEGRYVVIEGICEEIERTHFRRKIKGITIRTENGSVRIPVWGERTGKLKDGDTMVIYLSEDTPVYDLDGCKIVNTCIALARKTGGQK